MWMRIFKNTISHQKIDVLSPPKWYIDFVVPLLLKVLKCDLANKSQSQIATIEI